MLRALLLTARSGVILTFIDFRSILLKWFVQLIILTPGIYSFIFFLRNTAVIPFYFVRDALKIPSLKQLLLKTKLCGELMVLCLAMSYFKIFIIYKTCVSMGISYFCSLLLL